MSDDHDALAREQEREAADMQHQADSLGERIDAAKDELRGLESTETIATPDPSIEDVERRPGAGSEGPTLPSESERAAAQADED